MLKDNRLVPASQTAAFFHGHVAYDDIYSGTADVLEEGERLARIIGDKHVLFMKNHGVLVTGDNVAQAYRRLYRLERVCRAQVIAMSTGKPLRCSPTRSWRRCRRRRPTRHSRAERERLLRGDDAHPRPRHAGLRRLAEAKARLPGLLELLTSKWLKRLDVGRRRALGPCVTSNDTFCASFSDL